MNEEEHSDVDVDGDSGIAQVSADTGKKEAEEVTRMRKTVACDAATPPKVQLTLNGTPMIKHK